MRFPKLKWSMVEGGIGWIASVLQFMDNWWDDHHGWMEPKLPEKPSFYFHRQFFATFENDRAGVLTREMIGIENLMWGSDYPHTEGVWPYSRKKVAADLRRYSRGGYPQDGSRQRRARLRLSDELRRGHGHGIAQEQSRNCRCGRY